MGAFIQTLNGYLWGFPLIAFLFLTHIVMTVKTGLIQRKVFLGIRLSLSGDKGGEGEISPFSALATSLASTLGTGNIIGVGTAVALGGAGAVFWCWITGILGMATQYCECFLSVRYRQQTADGYSGGPMYVLEKGVGSRRLGVFYALLASLGGLITGAAIQSNSISNVILETVRSRNTIANHKVLSFAIGVVTATLAALVIFGGLKSISRVCSFFVPFMALAYTLGCFAVLFINRDVVIESLVVIIKEAFSMRAVSGGAFGSVMMLSCRYGVARGLFSNEAGIGTSSVISASAHTSSPVRQGLVSMTATFWDTVVMCLITGVVIVSSIITDDASVSAADSGSLCYDAFCRIPVVGEGLLVFSIVVFAFSTVLGWSAVGEKCIAYVFGDVSVRWYRGAWIGAVFLAPMISLEGIWDLGDLVNALLVAPNVLGLLLLSSQVRAATRKEIDNIRA
ncbi:MAG: sodium:alanine symporter family protein [Ruminococcus sp.]|nr:sodium:alanine symporter family protein [Ruminococcus sp.]